jgi:acetylornithine deacetylase/succinyl-diaminopimelate desuccinylase-like protein
VSSTQPNFEEQIDAAIHARLDGTVSSLLEYLRFPTVSVGDGASMGDAAEWLAQRYRDFGCTEVEVVETSTFPGVFAYYDAGSPITVLSYGMYDVRSTGDIATWDRDPFDPIVEPFGDFPSVVRGRGAHVPKGPDAAWMLGLEALKEVKGELPVNIIFLIEGDEILGSVSYGELIDRYRDRLADVDALVYLRGIESAKKDVAVRLGYKSFITFELTASAESWGRGSTTGVAHSALRTLVDSPALRLSQAITSLYTEDGEIAITDWHQHLDPAEVPAADRELVDALLARAEGTDLANFIPALGGLGVNKYVGDISGEEVLTKYIYGSALNIQGFHSGYTGPGTRTFTIPTTATARFDARLSTTADPQVFLDGLRTFLDRTGFSDIDINVLSAYPASRTPIDSALMRTFVDLAHDSGVTTTVWPVQAYGGPWAYLGTEFDMPVIFGAGIGFGAGVGMPNEYFVIDGGGKVNGLPELARFSAQLLDRFAAEHASQS